MKMNTRVYVHMCALVHVCLHVGTCVMPTCQQAYTASRHGL